MFCRKVNSVAAKFLHLLHPPGFMFCRKVNSVAAKFLRLHLPKRSRNPFPNPIPVSLFNVDSKPSSSQTTPLSLIRGGCYSDELASTNPNPLCSGCGVHMQNSGPSLPGYFTVPSPKSPDYRAHVDRSLPLNPDTVKSGLLTLLEEDIEESNKKNLILICARCHSLRHYGRVKNPSSEFLLPDFDFDKMIAPKILSPSGPRSVVLIVIDAADFEGSFPKKLANLLSTTINKNHTVWKEGKPANIPRVLLVVTKCDVLPPSVSPEWLDQWVRRRVHEHTCFLKLTDVHLVSSVKDWGVMSLVERVRELVGSRGNVWAVGAQNAGKSTLINAMGRCVGKGGSLTEAPVPGTTIGVVKVDGVLNGQAKLFDTPGILQPFQITTRLVREEQKLVVIGKGLRPRTYRITPGHSVHIGGLMRVDVEDSSVSSIYLTIFASPFLPLHMGKTENSSKIMQDHIGRQLQPPIGEDRVAELGKWTKKEFNVRGDRWDVNSVDIAAAGLGWVAIGLKGDVNIGVWTCGGIDVVMRSSLVFGKAHIFEEAGFTVSKIVSKADSVLNKPKLEKEKKQKAGKVQLPSTTGATMEGDLAISKASSKVKRYLDSVSKVMGS